MIINYHKIIILLFLSILIYFFNNKFLKYTNQKIYSHQKFSTDYLANPIGGYVIFLFIVLYNLYLDILELSFLFLIFFSGVLSDNKIFNSPIKRLFFQIFLIVICISYSELEIISTRIDILDQLLMNNLVNIIFTTFCILIVINGTNFIDGLNGLVISYYLIILILLLNLDLNLDLYYDNYQLVNFIFVLSILYLLNVSNKVFLGDNGSYLIGFLFSIYLIKLHQINEKASPYFIILLLWYPCFENLFSIIRKKIFKVLATKADNEHLHQLLFIYISEKFNIKNKIASNNTTSLLISIYNLIIFWISIKNFDQTDIQLLLLLINLTLYFSLYIFIKKSYKN